MLRGFSLESRGLQSSQFSLRPPMWSLGRALLSKAHSCKQQLVEGLISIKQAPGMNSRMTRVTTLRRGSSCQSPEVQCPRYPCKLEKRWRLVRMSCRPRPRNLPSIFISKNKERVRERERNTKWPTSSVLHDTQLVITFVLEKPQMKGS